MLHNIIDIFNFNYFKSFINDNIFNVVKIKKYIRDKTFVNVKKI